MWQMPKISVDDILVYLRKSRTDDPTLTVEEVLSKHEQMLDEWVARNFPDCGRRIPEENRFREVVSGETIASRPAVKEVLRLAELPRYKALLIVEPQRLSRGDLEDIGYLVKVLRYSGTLVITLQYTYDLTDERDRDFFERELKRGNEFLEYQKRILKNGRFLSVENGNFVASVAPYGYRKIDIREGKKVVHTLEPVPAEAKVVNMIFDWYLEGLGTTEIGNRLAGSGIPAPNGGKWGRSTVRKILDNVHYVGMVRWNYNKTVRSIKDGKVVASRPVSEDYSIFPGKHPAIVDQGKFEAVHRILENNPKPKKSEGLVNPLAGLLYCKCGARMVYMRYSNRAGKHCEPRYSCLMSARCGEGSCLASELLDYMKVVLEKSIESFEMRADDVDGEDINEYISQISKLEKRLAELDKVETAQWERYTLDGMPKSVFERLNEKVLNEKREVERALTEARITVPERLGDEERLANFRTALRMMNDPGADVETLNEALRNCITRITYSRPRRAANMHRNNEPFTAEVELNIPCY